jgi:hypothetical protein
MAIALSEWSLVKMASSFVGAAISLDWSGPEIFVPLGRKLNRSGVV